MDTPERPLWAPPVRCRWCGYPMARGTGRCPNCDVASGLALRHRVDLWTARSLDLTFDLAALAAGTAVLVLLLPLSPVLTLFPLLFVGRKGRTGRKRRRRRPRPPGGRAATPPP